MHPDDLKTYTTVALALWNAGLTIAMWLRKPGQDAGAAVAKLRAEHGGELAAVNLQLVQIKTELKHMPNREEMAQLEGTVSMIDERTKGMAENMARVSVQLNRIETYLLEKK